MNMNLGLVKHAKHYINLQLTKSKYQGSKTKTK